VTSSQTDAVATLNAGVTWSNASNLSTNESGTTATYGAVLDKAPSKDVTLTLTISDATEGVFVSTGTTTLNLLFTPSNWSQVQNVQVKGVDDDEYDRDVAYTISTKVTSRDLDYDGMRNAQGLPTSNINVTNVDDDIPVEWRGTGNNDVYTSGPGADDLYGDYGRDDISGGKGNDRIYGGYGDDVLSGQDGKDSIEGEPGDDLIYGGAGDDSLNGGTGNDTLLGGEGNDVLDGDKGVDSMDGGNGADTYYIDNPGDVVEDTGTDNSIDILYIASYLTSPVLLGRGVENATLNDSAGKGSITGNDSNNTLNGNASDNSLSGGSGNDTLESGAGNDSVDAGTGDDLIVGGEGAGNDTYVGGTGTDTVKYTSAVNTVLINLLEGLAEGKDIGTDKLSEIENLIGGQTGDTLIGDNNANNINAYTGNDTITGNGGNDTIDGGEGQDTVVYASNASSYTVTSISGGYQVVSKLGLEGTDTLLNVESLKFADQTAVISSFATSGTGTSTSAKFWKDNTKAPTDTKKADAVNLTDAIAILKMIVGLNVNSNNTPLSPYQAIAADFDQSGDIGLTDAIGVLKMVVGLSAPTPTWKYYDDTKLNSAYTSAQSLNPKAWTTNAVISDAGTADSSVKLVGVLTGDVDGSWVSA
jgi:Ca2+-binding RTX toxin-like protein